MYPKLTLLICFAVSLFVMPASIACPVYLDVEKVPSATNSLRRQLKLFAVEVTPSGVRHWINLPMQIDALDDKGILKQNPIGKEMKNLPIEANDRINLRREKFGFKVVPSDGAPCATDKGIELQNPESDGKFAYLVHCNNDDAFANTHPNPVSINPVIHKITAPRFEYDYQPNN